MKDAEADEAVDGVQRDTDGGRRERTEVVDGDVEEVDDELEVDVDVDSDVMKRKRKSTKAK